ncbi:hypothetical protein EUTSA_v10026707mg [Eutrema salsugineum]|uniref:Uncharacterized protein n=1 Tax=Eutrema salsugineum TaxID=72664 RepID=V4MKD0_EUTSA|nr:hypothetical protein EUTSA_v10026707mg [Eutrema salsugineum]
MAISLVKMRSNSEFDVFDEVIRIRELNSQCSSAESSDPELESPEDRGTNRQTNYKSLILVNIYHFVLYVVVFVVGFFNFP